jgi:hypothetical protein
MNNREGFAFKIINKNKYKLSLNQDLFLFQEILLNLTLLCD